MRKLTVVVFSIALASMVVAQDSQPVAPRLLQRVGDLNKKKVIGENKNQIGTMDDMIVDVRSGRLVYATWTMQESSRNNSNPLIIAPFSAFSMPSDASVFVLSKPFEDSRRKYEFKRGQWPNLADNKWAEQLFRDWKQEPYWIVRQDASAAAAPTHAWSQPLTKWFRAGDLRGKDVFMSNQDLLGRIDDAVVDVNLHRIGYLILTGSKQYVIPWSAVQFDDELRHIRVNLTRDQTLTAPQISGSTLKSFEDVSWVTTVHDFYQVKPYWMDPRDQEQSRKEP